MAFDPDTLFGEMAALYDDAIGRVMSRPLGPQISALLSGARLAAVLSDEIGGALQDYVSTGYDVAELLDQVYLFKKDAPIQRVPQINVDSKRGVIVGQNYSTLALDRLIKGQEGFIQQAVAQVQAGILDEQVLGDALRTVKGQAKTIIGTGLAGLQRTVQNDLGERISTDGRKLALYSGEVRTNSRPYCKALKGKVVDLDILRRTPNGHGLDASVFCGGYNCIDSLIPVTSDMMRENGWPEATLEDYERAKQGAARR